MKIMKRNQVIILVIAIMLVTAGYLNFIETNNNQETVQTNGNDVQTMGDATFVSSQTLVQNTLKKNTNTFENETTNQTSAQDNEETEEAEYFTSSKLQRETMYSQMIESYQKMLDSTTISAEQEAIAQNEITKINDTKNAIMITENLIKTKGFNEVLILVNDTSINVIISKEELKQEEIAQIQNIVSREMKAEIGNIHISNTK